MIATGLVSTIIPVHNRPVVLRRAVDSVLEQTYRPIEILIVDDGSSDDTPQVISEYTARHPAVIRGFHQIRSGPGVARELGRRNARGEFIQYLDSDDWLYPNKFADQVRALREHPHCAISYGTTSVSTLEGKILESSSRFTGQSMTRLFPTLLTNRWWFIHTPLYRRWISDAVGAWSTMRQREDWDYDARVGSLDVALVHCGSVVSNHAHYQSPDRASQASSTDCLLYDATFLPRLFACGLLAGVPIGSDEMDQFSRWAFFTARQLDRLGYPQEALRLLQLAGLSSGSNPISVNAYGFARTYLRPRLASCLAERISSMRRGRR